MTLNVQMTRDAAAPLFAFRLVYSYYVNEVSNHTHPVRALGPHDNNAYQLDNAKYICLDMNRPVHDDVGAELTVYRSSGTGTASVQGANSWQGPWTTIGTANAAQTSFDIGAVGLDSARYVKLTASGQFFLDAVEGLNYVGAAERPLPPPAPLRLAVSPNPARNTVRFALGRQPGPGSRITVCDAAGRAVARLPVAAATANWRCAEVPAGVYFATLDRRTAPVRLVLGR
ncbi:hypothetical protein FJY71_03915 [candidate division WOR-3 bacterium]|nr:hypothetical protein [candidate division WOR-3 bacterium]